MESIRVLRLSGLAGVIASAAEAAAYRIVSEAMRNASLHSGGSRCLARIDVLDGHLEIEVTDDGCGTTARTPGGVGLLSMVERAAELGGWCVVDASPGTGTVVRSELPVGAR